ncbi:MAG TPA: hypothetical protein ENH84_04400 [Phycisphaerae bacterium]|nr:hypothetical protein [Phycisphaerae bacterium]
MTEQAKQDEMLLIDFLLGRLDAEIAEAVRQRLQSDPAFRRRRDDLGATFAALELARDPEPQGLPDLSDLSGLSKSLVDKTLARIMSVRRTNALLDVQQIDGRRSFRPTFSLKEFAAVAAMLLVMAGVLVPSLRVARQRSQLGFCAAQLGQIGSAMQTYAINHDGYLPNSDAREARWLRGGPHPPASNSTGLFKLLRGRYLSSPVVFQCPAVGGQSFAMRPEMNDFPLPEHISYSYQYSLGEKGLSNLDPLLAKAASEMAILADQTPQFANGRFLKECARTAISNNHPKTQNVLYLDGHVQCADNASVGVERDNIFLVEGVYEYEGNEAPARATDTFLLPAHPNK